ncbi:MAG: hypothetical protein ACR2NA_07105, partial [Solirubrobacterales bacterium]
MIVVPDRRTWAGWGVGIEELAGTRATRPRLVLPEKVPGSWVPAAASLAREVADPETTVVSPSPLDGVPVSHALEAAGAPTARSLAGVGDGTHEGEHSMMATVGEPGSDGLIMQDSTARIGPLTGPFAAGLVATLELGGDVVCSCELQPTVHTMAGDPTAPAASRWALQRAGGRGEMPAAHRLAAVEIERATSHAGWTAQLGVLLGWRQLTAAARAAQEPLREGVAALLAQRPPTTLSCAEEALATVARLLESRRAAGRLAGRGVLEREAAEGLDGPVARASGICADARAADGAYDAVGFEPRIGTDGDARERARQRVGEARDAIGLARRALSHGRIPQNGGTVGATHRSPAG